MTDPKIEFNPTHHAVLFALISQETIQRAGEKEGSAAVRKAVRRYGEQRGKRMAMRVQQDNLPTDMTHFMAYGEWRAAPGLSQSEQDTVDDTPRSLVFRCPWHEAWVENDLNDAGRLYCLEIDTSLARGYNPDLELSVHGTRSNGAPACEFVYHGADLDALKQVQVDEAETVMGWDYHLGHLYKTMTEVLTEELGITGTAAAKTGLARFEIRYGKEASGIVREFENTSFDQLPRG